MSDQGAAVAVSTSDRYNFWQKKWDTNQTGFHNAELNKFLSDHADQLSGSNKPRNIFVPLCGKSVDMKWFADKGIETVGLDVIRLPLEKFFTEHGMDWEEEDAPALGAQSKLFSSKTHPIKLYCADIVNYSPEIDGQFDAVWDRGSISAVNREDLDKYVNLMKNLVRTGGRILMEVVQYDVSIMDDVDRPPERRPPPPFPLYEEDLNRMYGPEFSVQFLEKRGSNLVGKDIEQALFLLVRN
ncbi:hypothetical protein EGW08_016911 [Elysia chlorotica]|uniref:thiopurine S-methyltransferase n=1 Tax=Elysia chlorotica TaxID=188477 RepID=A0A433T189_ELYCH|nr:hypothetical protein EGW08_016911 [Elysia chlorotica]